MSQPSQISKLIQGCVLHASTHQTSKSPSISKCTSLMKKLKSLIVQLESEDSVSNDLFQFCSLYRSILNRTFCPTALAIFEDGELQAMELRLHFLLTAVLNTLKTAKGAEISANLEALTSFSTERLLAHDGATQDATSPSPLTEITKTLPLFLTQTRTPLAKRQFLEHLAALAIEIQAQPGAPVTIQSRGQDHAHKAAAPPNAPITPITPITPTPPPRTLAFPTPVSLLYFLANLLHALGNTLLTIAATPRIDVTHDTVESYVTNDIVNRLVQIINGTCHPACHPVCLPNFSFVLQSSNTNAALFLTTSLVQLANSPAAAFAGRPLLPPHTLSSLLLTTSTTLINHMSLILTPSPDATAAPTPDAIASLQTTTTLLANVLLATSPSFSPALELFPVLCNLLYALPLLHHALAPPATSPPPPPLYSPPALKHLLSVLLGTIYHAIKHVSPTTLAHLRAFLLASPPDMHQPSTPGILKSLFKTIADSQSRNPCGYACGILAHLLNDPRTLVAVFDARSHPEADGETKRRRLTFEDGRPERPQAVLGFVRERMDEFLRIARGYKDATPAALIRSIKPNEAFEFSGYTRFIVTLQRVAGGNGEGTWIRRAGEIAVEATASVAEALRIGCQPDDPDSMDDEIRVKTGPKRLLKILSALLNIGLTLSLQPDPRHLPHLRTISAALREIWRPDCMLFPTTPTSTFWTALYRMDDYGQQPAPPSTFPTGPTQPQTQAPSTQAAPPMDANYAPPRRDSSARSPCDKTCLVVCEYFGVKRSLATLRDCECSRTHDDPVMLQLLIDSLLPFATRAVMISCCLADPNPSASSLHSFQTLAKEASDSSDKNGLFSAIYPCMPLLCGDAESVSFALKPCLITDALHHGSGVCRRSCAVGVLELLKPLSFPPLPPRSSPRPPLLRLLSSLTQDLPSGPHPTPAFLPLLETLAKSEALELLLSPHEFPQVKLALLKLVVRCITSPTPTSPTPTSPILIKLVERDRVAAAHLAAHLRTADLPPPPGDDKLQSPAPSLTPFLYLICGTFSEPNRAIRATLQHSLGALLSANDFAFLRSMFDSEDSDSQDSLQDSLSAFFELFDLLTKTHSSFSATSSYFSQSNTHSMSVSYLSTPRASNTYDEKRSRTDPLTPPTDVLHILSSLPSSASPHPLLLSHTLKRLVNCMLTSNDSIEAIAQNAIMQLNKTTPLSSFLTVHSDCSDSPHIVCILREFLSQTRQEDGQTNFFHISLFLNQFVCGFSKDDKNLYAYARGITRVVLPGLVLEQDLANLKNWGEFCFSLYKMAPHNSSGPPVMASNSEEYMSGCYTQHLDAVLARCLLEARKPPIVFMLREICKDAYTMQRVIADYSSKLLKVLVNEIGYGDANERRAVECIKLAAVWYGLPPSPESSSAGKRSQQPSQASVRPLEGVDAMLNPTSSQRNSSQPTTDGDKEEAAKLWMKPHVMFLFVHIIEKWNTKDRKQRRHALRCFCGIVRFLHVSEAALYLPKILSCVSIGMGDKSGDIQLRYFACKGLSEFVRVMCDASAEGLEVQLSAEDDEETNDEVAPREARARDSEGKKNIAIIGRALSTIIVALFPILHNADTANVDATFSNLAVSEATSLITYLVFAVGEKLRPYLANIPFLPRHPELMHVRDKLKAMGIDFDELAESDGESNKTFQAVFQWRLKSLCNIMGHENVRVRHAVAEHLTLIIKEQRGLFRRLIDSEQSSSNRFLTVVIKDAHLEAEAPVISDTPNTSLTNDVRPQSGPPGQVQVGGGVSTLITTVMTRCWKEPDDKVKLALATLLGEIGAIDSTRLGLIQGGSGASGEDDEESDLAWRASQPPWKSSMLRYALQLLYSQLVVALKGGITSQDQDKVGFAIQEVLKLCHELASKDDQPATEMNTWLSEKLESNFVLHIVEPFWTTSYRRTNTADVARPPFFTAALTYHHWIAKWCRFLANKANNNSRSCWKRLFVACDSTMRAAAGVGVAEFLLPLLVLDVACFGDKDDGDDVVQEMMLVLNGGGGDDGSSDNKKDVADYLGMVRNPQCTDDHRRAVNTVFAILETLETWADEEVEERSKLHSVVPPKAKKGRGSRAAVAAEQDDLDDGGREWPSDEGIERIQAISSQITLQMRADAAIRVGSHARAVKYLEMNSRAVVAEEFFGDEVVEMLDDEDEEETTGFGKGLGRALAPVVGEDVGKMQMLLGALNDVDGMAAFGGGEQLVEQIHHKEVCGDWSAAMLGYEQALILHEAGQQGQPQQRHKLQKGLLRCLLQVGSLEMVLNQVGGLLNRDENSSVAAQQLLPSAMEAAWRLQRWPLLEELLDRLEGSGEMGGMDTESAFQIGVGKAMRALHQGNQAKVLVAIDDARLGLMGDVANAARESYSRSRGLILKLQALREVEFAADMLCRRGGGGGGGENFSELAGSSRREGWDWDNRLELLGNTGGSGVNAVVSARLALTKLASETNIEGGLWMSIAKRARKMGMVQIAQSALAQASRTKGKDSTEEQSEIDLQLAKVKFNENNTSDALKIVEAGGGMSVAAVSKMVDTFGVSVGGGEREKDANGKLAEHFHKCFGISTSAFGRRLLAATEWMVQDNLKHGSEIKERYLLLLKLTPLWEKSHFYYARYLDGLFEARVAAVAAADLEGGAADDDEKRQRAIKLDCNSHTYVKDAIDFYFRATMLGDKHLYRGFPRLLSLWFEFCSLKVDCVPSESAGSTKSRGSKAVAAYGRRGSAGGAGASGGKSGAGEEYRSDADRVLHEMQKKIVLQIIKKNVRSIPSHVYYTALPQLISRVKHSDPNTIACVQTMMRACLASFPLQAMWNLAWLQNSKSEDHVQMCTEIFNGASRDLGRAGRTEDKQVLDAAASLFRHLKAIADHVPDSTQQKKMSVPSWKGDRGVKLCQFVPPVQAALSVNLARIMSDSEKKARMDNKAEVFPVYVPRMSSFSSSITVMSSKAKPKKLTAYATNVNREGGPTGKRIGELHFLVKKEEKGDLRKDSRVQDLNNVLNRILNVGSSSGTRKMTLRTFSVTCLSEDTGILEWVPNTESLRSLIQKSYNPQARPESIKRRGHRLADFGDVRLRNAFMACQSKYVDSGNLVMAGEMFERNCLKTLPPVLYWYFVKKFADPHEWFEARMRFTLSVAVWSAVGHVIGLGDRHTENILLDVSTGEVVHVDFDCLFDKGLKLARPEVVPFRLTANMIDCMGASGYEGSFRGGMINCMRVLREQRELLLAVLQPFILDPIIQWKSRDRSRNEKAGPAGREVANDAGRKNIAVIDGRLRGVFNLVNPNNVKIKRTDGHVAHQEDDDGRILPLGVEGQVNKLIIEATKSENLVQMYVGWMSWV